VMSIAGHQIGRTAAHFMPRIRTDLLTGIAFVAIADSWSSGSIFRATDRASERCGRAD